MIIMDKAITAEVETITKKRLPNDLNIPKAEPVFSA